MALAALAVPEAPIERDPKAGSWVFIAKPR
jgi:hypothetical protein